ACIATGRAGAFVVGVGVDGDVAAGAVHAARLRGGARLAQTAAGGIAAEAVHAEAGRAVAVDQARGALGARPRDAIGRAHAFIVRIGVDGDVAAGAARAARLRIGAGLAQAAARGVAAEAVHAEAGRAVAVHQARGALRALASIASGRTRAFV